ncbi:MAG: phosphatidylserine decarboxylase [Parachlamydiales bacterium]|nr:phosphatidylserine decarboxylase [Parachlamydiales bacterium]
MPIEYLDRATGKQKVEDVYFGKAIEFVYGDSLISKIFGKAALHLLVKWSFFAWWFGICQSLPSSRKKIQPFIDKFKVDSYEFFEPVSHFKSFNEFFYRKLKASSRPIAVGKNVAVMPTDGRYLFYPNITMADGFVVKGKKFDLRHLLKNTALAKKYDHGSMVMVRLCPTDYHRFHFPCDGIPSKSHLINGWLYSVNPVSLKKSVKRFTQNKRVITEISSELFGKVLMIEIGATCVGSIHQTFTPGTFYEKGEEKGYFSFGASAIIMLFEPDAIHFDEDLIESSKHHIEVRCLLGQSLGRAGPRI